MRKDFDTSVGILHGFAGTMAEGFTDWSKNFGKQLWNGTVNGAVNIANKAQPWMRWGTYINAMTSLPGAYQAMHHIFTQGENFTTDDARALENVAFGIAMKGHTMGKFMAKKYGIEANKGFGTIKSNNGKTIFRNYNDTRGKLS